VAPHDWLVKKYNGDGEEVQKGRGVIPWPFHCVSDGLVVDQARVAAGV
jgi:hypothetical protein